MTLAILLVVAPRGLSYPRAWELWEQHCGEDDVRVAVHSPELKGASEYERARRLDLRFEADDPPVGGIAFMREAIHAMAVLCDAHSDFVLLLAAPDAVPVSKVGTGWRREMGGQWSPWRSLARTTCVRLYAEVFDSFHERAMDALKICGGRDTAAGGALLRSVLHEQGLCGLNYSLNAVGDRERRAILKTRVRDDALLVRCATELDDDFLRLVYTGSVRELCDAARAAPEQPSVEPKEVACPLFAYQLTKERVLAADYSVSAMKRTILAEFPLSTVFWRALDGVQIAAPFAVGGLFLCFVAGVFPGGQASDACAKCAGCATGAP